MLKHYLPLIQRVIYAITMEEFSIFNYIFLTLQYNFKLLFVLFEKDAVALCPKKYISQLYCQTLFQ